MLEDAAEGALALLDPETPTSLSARVPEVGDTAYWHLLTNELLPRGLRQPGSQARFRVASIAGTIVEVEAPGNFLSAVKLRVQNETTHRDVRACREREFRHPGRAGLWCLLDADGWPTLEETVPGAYPKVGSPHVGIFMKTIDGLKAVPAQVIGVDEDDPSRLTLLTTEAHVVRAEQGQTDRSWSFEAFAAPVPVPVSGTPPRLPRVGDRAYLHFQKQNFLPLGEAQAGSPTRYGMGSHEGVIDHVDDPSDPQSRVRLRFDHERTIAEALVCRANDFRSADRQGKWCSLTKDGAPIEEEPTGKPPVGAPVGVYLRDEEGRVKLVAGRVTDDHSSTTSELTIVVPDTTYAFAHFGPGYASWGWAPYGPPQAIES